MTPQVLQAVYGCPRSRADRFARPLAAGMALAQVDTRHTRAAAFLAQIGHESGCLAFVREIWGPTKQQLRYEPVTSLSKMLGNTEPGDGARFPGRGLIQTTGRANHAMTRDRLRAMGFECPDFEAEPHRLEEPLWAALSAGLFWHVKRLNRWADADDFAGLTRAINGGYNGLAHRQALYARALLTEIPLRPAANDRAWRLAAGG